MMFNEKQDTQIEKLIETAAKADVFEHFLNSDDEGGFFSDTGSHGSWYADAEFFPHESCSGDASQNKKEIYNDPAMQKYFEERISFWKEAIFGTGKYTLGSIIKEFTYRDAPNEKRFLDGWDFSDLEGIYYSIAENRDEEDQELSQNEKHIEKFINDFIDYLHASYDANESYDFDSIDWYMRDFIKDCIVENHCIVKK